jgi:WD40 repeat protein
MIVNKVAEFSGHKDCIYALEYIKGDHFVSAGSDGLLVSWNTKEVDNGVLLANIPNSVYATHYLPQEHQLLVGQNFEGVYKIDIEKKLIVQSAQVSKSQIFDIKTDHQHILLSTGDGQLIVLNRNDLSVVNKYQLSEKSARCIAINPLHGCFAVGFSDYSIKIISFDGFKTIADFVAHKNSVFALCFDPTGKYLLSGSRDASIQVWDAEHNYQHYKSIAAHMFAINDLKYSPDGRFFASASMDKTIKIWDSQSFRLLKVIDRARHGSHRTSVNKISWGGNQLASASDDKNIFLWDIQSS